jgi:GT2 family glycosyltransferase
LDKAMSISVIIATYNRANLLDECLEHLCRQPFETGDEVIVVDNGSTDTTAQVIDRHQRTYPVPLRHLEERRPGKAHALTAAILVATGDVLAFTDDDVNVEGPWLGELRTAIAGEGVGLVGGPVAPRWEHRAPRWLRFTGEGYGRLGAPLGLLDYGIEPVEIGPRTLLGANLAVRRDVLLNIGGFARHLGKLRGTLLSGEDQDLCRRVQAAGFKAIYIPTASVLHFVPASRMRVPYFLFWFFWSGITFATLDQAEGIRPRSVLGVPLYLVRRAAAGLVGVLTTAARGRFASAIDRALDLAFAAGYAAKCWNFVALERSASPASGKSGT